MKLQFSALLPRLAPEINRIFRAVRHRIEKAPVKKIIHKKTALDTVQEELIVIKTNDAP